MNLWSSAKLAAATLGLSVAVTTTGCSRDHIEAINLANEADRSVKVNVEGAVQRYEQAVQLDPTNHRILYKLALAYERKEDWDKLASTMARATQLAPEFASYWFKRGYALIRQAQAGNADAYQQAKEPLQKCTEKDPHYGECYFYLGEAMEWTDDEQGALANFTKAIEHDPTTAFYYPALAQLYNTLRFNKEAEAVLKEGTRLVPPTEKNANHLYNMYLLLFNVAQARDDKPSMVAAMEKANEIAGENHPEISFNLGSTYAVMDPPQKEKSVQLLKSFTKRACSGSSAKKFKEQCETANALIQKLGS